MWIVLCHVKRVPYTAPFEVVHSREHENKVEAEAHGRKVDENYNSRGGCNNVCSG